MYSQVKFSRGEIMEWEFKNEIHYLESKQYIGSIEVENGMYLAKIESKKKTKARLHKPALVFSFQFGTLESAKSVVEDLMDKFSR